MKFGKNFKKIRDFEVLGGVLLIEGGGEFGGFAACAGFVVWFVSTVCFPHSLKFEKKIKEEKMLEIKPESKMYRK
ncbi:MAG: hypothetical protein IJD43_15475 [Thermoguttaceae bacterium]|nr:hypothetical protein [Thermoguttaceae bacterium]